MSATTSTPVEVIANVSRVVTRVVDRITGDRADCPLLVACAAHEALKLHGIPSRVMFGKTAWVEILEDNSVVWAGCWGESHGFWVATEMGEVVDLNTSVNYRKQAHQIPNKRPMMSPPLLWSAEVPVFYRYVPEGVAEPELGDERESKQWQVILREIQEKCTPEAMRATLEAAGPDAPPEFPNEPIICPGRKILDDSLGSFKQFDRVIGIRGVPKAPI